MKSKEQKRKEALARQEVADKMSPFQRLSKLDGLFGFQKGARKERGRLTRGLCSYIQRSGCMYQQKKAEMAPVHIADNGEIVEGPEHKTEEETKEEACVGMQTPLVEKKETVVIPKPRERYIIATTGKEQEAR